MDSALRGLNAAQKAAVTSPASILQVLAPPGSGKTKTLTSRVAYLLQNGYHPQNVICCTFTIKAAREMRERLRGLVGAGMESKLILGTFHSICRRYLVAYGGLIGVPKNFGIADSNDSLGIIKRLQKKIKFSMDPRVARNRISHRKARGQRLEDVIRSNAKSMDAQEFVTIFQEYESALATSNLLDYDDLLLRCVELLRRHPECVSNVEALLIDEFQDTNIVQFELMTLLASANQRITIVGDPDQSIYGFRSAEIANLKRMHETYPETMVINLEENYRSSTSVLNLAQEVIEQDEDRPSKKLKSTHRYGTLPVLRRLYNPHEEAAWIVSEIQRVTRLTGNCIEHHDIAILLRSAFLSLLIEKALANAGIPYKMVGGRRFFDRVEVKLVLDYMRTIYHPDNNSALLAIINTPARKVGEVTLAELTRAAEENKTSLWSCTSKALNGEVRLTKKLSKPAEKGLAEIVSLIRRGREKLKTFEPAECPGRLIEFIVNTLHLRDWLKSEYREDWEERWENVKELSTQAQDVTLQAITAEDQLPEVEGVEQAQINDAQEVLARFLANVALSTEVEAEEEEQVASRITISTIHSAKGLEWPVVFVPAVYEGSIPHSRAEDTAEERRLLYVAMTRAKALLYMTFPLMQSRGESESILTQFLPSSLNHLLGEVGPSFNDRCVQDIATILGRPIPSQESLARGLQSMEENGSFEDDLWPVDGSLRLRTLGDEAHLSSCYQASEQTMVDAISIKTSFQQRSKFSTVAGFTSAAYQMTVHAQESQVPSNKRPSKLGKSVSGQGNIATFFAQGTSTSAEKENLPPLQAVAGSHSVSKLSTKVAPPSIPSELASHRPSSLLFANPASGWKRQRQVISEIPEMEPAAKRQYTCFSSSPARETCQESRQESQLGSKTSRSTVTSGTKLGNLQQEKSKTGLSSYKSCMLNTLTRIAPLNSDTSLATLGNGSKKTLGVRRSMTGWADRKNK